tara:strand:+ start:510 stop:650 length:141 start_codon:yes stop_codon:yes gene_type:complete
MEFPHEYSSRGYDFASLDRPLLVPYRERFGRRQILSGVLMLFFLPQ